VEVTRKPKPTDMPTEILLEEIEELEEANSMRTTSDLAGRRKVDAGREYVEFRQRKGVNLCIIGVFILGLMLIISRSFFIKPRGDSAYFGGMLFAGIIEVFLLAIFLKALFKEPAYLKIRVDPSGISVDDKDFPWDEITQTAIMTKGSSRQTSYFLVIAMKNKAYETFALADFITMTMEGFPVTLAKYIEHFKPSRR
jgi:hypothetical protein